MNRFAALLLPLVLGACAFAPPTPAPTAVTLPPQRLSAEENAYAPQPTDAKLLRAEVMLFSVDLSERTDLSPARIQAQLLGAMTDACQQLRIKANPPDAQYRITLDVYSVAEPGVRCENVFRQFEVSILLGAYSRGRYQVWVNGQMVGDFVTYE